LFILVVKGNVAVAVSENELDETVVVVIMAELLVEMQEHALSTRDADPPQFAANGGMPSPGE
jgi:hypothetical protein